jgi:hypothetical protein
VLWAPDSVGLPALSEVLRLYDEGGVIANGQRLTPGGAPYGSERYWGLPATATTPASTLGDFIFSNDFPNIMASFDAPTGLTGSNMKFTEQEFYDVHELTAPESVDGDLRRAVGVVAGAHLRSREAGDRRHRGAVQRFRRCLGGV